MDPFVVLYCGRATLERDSNYIWMCISKSYVTPISSTFNLEEITSATAAVSSPIIIINNLNTEMASAVTISRGDFHEDYHGEFSVGIFEFH